jgi:hypothetical protein
MGAVGDHNFDRVFCPFPGTRRRAWWCRSDPVIPRIHAPCGTIMANTPIIPCDKLTDAVGDSNFGRRFSPFPREATCWALCLRCGPWSPVSVPVVPHLCPRAHRRCGSPPTCRAHLTIFYASPDGGGVTHGGGHSGHNPEPRTPWQWVCV